MFGSAPSFTDTKIRHTVSDTMTRVFEIARLFPQLMLDATYTPVSHAWFFHPKTQRKLRKHFWSLPSYQSQAWDCENFAVELNQWICKEAALADVDAAPQTFVYCVDNRTPWAGVKDGKHALNLVIFDTGPRIIEPQSIAKAIAHCKAVEYPNACFKVYQ